MEKNNAAIYLCAPVNALVEGIYEQKVPFREIRKHGDFGLGTFDHLDGEMVMLDGLVYQVTGDGEVRTVKEDLALTPFACVTFFRPLSHDDSNRDLSYAGFLEWLGELLPSPNIFYAIRIEGTFSQVRVRSVSKQDSLRPLVEIAKEQSVFEFTSIQGTVAGFYTPSFMSSLNVPGMHLHFLSSDRTRGGHLLECRPRKIRTGIQMITRLELSLPMSLDYLTWDFQRDTGKDLEQVER